MLYTYIFLNKDIAMKGPADHNKTECFVLFMEWIVSAIWPTIGI